MYLIESDQKVTAGVSLMRRLKVVETRQMSTGTAGVCVPANNQTLKLVEVRNGGLEVREILPSGLRGAPFI